MLTTRLINPQIISVLSKCGHGDKILISDGNYPIDLRSGDAEKIYIALEKDCPTVTKVVEVLKNVVNFEKAELMTNGTNTETEIYREFCKLLPDIEFIKYDRFDYYDICCKPEVKLAIMTGESRKFANILLTVGVA